VPTPTPFSRGVKPVLDGYAGGNIHRAFWNGQDTQEEDDTYNGVSTYTAWLSTANIVPQVGTRAVIRTGTDRIELEACDRFLRLVCDGLALDRGPMGAPPDLTPTPARTWRTRSPRGKRLRGMR
jgi:hypothetical protein